MSEMRLQPAIQAIQKRFGPGAVRSLGSFELSSPLSCVPTGFSQLDKALGIGGVPRQRITELVGRPTSGASTLALKIMASTQAQGDRVAFVDLEESFDPDHASLMGVDVANLLLVSNPKSGEALEIIRHMVASGAVGLVVFHSIELLLDAGEGTPSIKIGLARLKQVLKKSLCAIVFLTPSHHVLRRRSLPSFASVRLLTTRQKWLVAEEELSGYRSRVMVLKNQFAPSGCSVSIDIRLASPTGG